jgi:hypothetical protein
MVLRARPTNAEAGSSYAALPDLLQPVIGGLEPLPVPQRRALAVALLLEESGDPVDPRLVAHATKSLLEEAAGPIRGPSSGARSSAPRRACRWRRRWPCSRSSALWAARARAKIGRLGGRARTELARRLPAE